MDRQNLIQRLIARRRVRWCFGSPTRQPANKGKAICACRHQAQPKK